MNINNFDADHILPESKNGSDDIENGILLSRRSNEEKADNLIGTINGYEFEVKNIGNGIGELYVDDELVSN